jgi:hypothetical protein
MNRGLRKSTYSPMTSILDRLRIGGENLSDNRYRVFGPAFTLELLLDGKSGSEADDT